MKDEKLAEEYYYKTYPVTLNIGEEERKEKVIDIYLAGLKAGRPKWHKMDYKDKESCRNIPKYTELLTRYNCGLFEAHCVNKWTGDHWCEHTYGVSEWCEIPK